MRKLEVLVFLDMYIIKVYVVCLMLNFVFDRIEYFLYYRKV